jgi:hypothetical protein
MEHSFSKACGSVKIWRGDYTRFCGKTLRSNQI